MNELIYPEFEQVDGSSIISVGDYNPTLVSPKGSDQISFLSTKISLADPEYYKSFLKSIESMFRASKEYKVYKGYLMSLGFTNCQVMGNIEADTDVSIELHHNILNLFDLCILISEHFLNTVGSVCTFDVLQVLIYEHFENRVPCCFLSSTAHEMYTNDPNAYIPPNMTIGKWWELIDRYKYGITYDIAQKLIRYITKYKNEIPLSVNIMQQEQILNFAYANEYHRDNPVPMQNQLHIGGFT